MNIIKERDKRIMYRQMRKRKLDEVIPLSAAKDGDLWAPLLDEGAVVPGLDIELVIVKGTLQKYLDSIPDDFGGIITMGHLDFVSQFPLILGEWDKNDLRLVDLENGRKGLDVRMRLNTGLNIVQDLMSMPYTFGISARLHYHEDVVLSERFNVPVASHIWMDEFGIVGDAGNVRSSGIDLSRFQII